MLWAFFVSVSGYLEGNKKLNLIMGPLTHLNIFPHIAGGTFSILFNCKYTFRPTCVSTTR